MSRTIDYPEQTVPNENSEIAIVYNGITKKIKLKNIGNQPSAMKVGPAFQECLNSSNVRPFTGTAIGTGTVANVASIANHPGILRMSSSATANTGYSFRLAVTGVLLIDTWILLGGLERFDAIVRFPNTASLQAYLGFSNTVIGTAPTYGAWFDVAGTTLTGKTVNGGATQTTGTSYVLVANTWYRMKITVNAAASTITFSLYSEAGVLLWTDSLSAEIPTSGVDVNVSARWTAAAATALLDLDFLSFQIDAALER